MSEGRGQLLVIGRSSVFLWGHFQADRVNNYCILLHFCALNKATVNYLTDEVDDCPASSIPEKGWVRMVEFSEGAMLS